jgi:hypothetical protein
LCWVPTCAELIERIVADATETIRKRLINGKKMFTAEKVALKECSALMLPIVPVSGARR